MRGPPEACFTPPTPHGPSRPFVRVTFFYLRSRLLLGSRSGILVVHSSSLVINLFWVFLPCSTTGVEKRREEKREGALERKAACMCPMLFSLGRQGGRGRAVGCLSSGWLLALLDRNNNI